MALNRLKPFNQGEADRFLSRYADRSLSEQLGKLRDYMRAPTGREEWGLPDVAEIAVRRSGWRDARPSTASRWPHERMHPKPLMNTFEQKTEGAPPRVVCRRCPGYEEVA